MAVEASPDPISPEARSSGIRAKLAGARPSELSDWLASSRVGQLMLPLTLMTARNARAMLAHENTKMLALAFAYCCSEQVEGDYAEFGVYRGRTFVEAWRVARRFPLGPRRFLAFDSFEGLPEGEDADGAERFGAGDFTNTLDAFRGRLRRARVPAADVSIVPGFFDQTLADPEQIPTSKIAIAWIDCDLYVSTVPVLEFLTDRLAQGAVMVFDDWYCFQGASDQGEAGACAEWLEKNPSFRLVPWQQHNWAGQAFIFRREE